MREIVLDTETTGMEPSAGDKIVEIGCVELDNHLPTGRTLHLYLNPERDVPPEAAAVHGLTNDFLKDKPVFAEVVGDFLDFIGDDAKLIIHNAEFDMKFLNWELKTLGFPSLDARRAVDTVLMARKKFPGSPANLDALCRRFNVDNTGRTLHGALLDSQLLAEVYLELLGGRQRGLLEDEPRGGAQKTLDAAVTFERIFREPRPHSANDEEKAAHQSVFGKKS